jgi:ribonucleoside-diphosphate reductase alpha chain
VSDISRKILSDIVVYSKYARYVPSKKRRETWEETVLRNAEMHATKFPAISDEIYQTYQYVLNRQVLPSMRSLQFGGKPIEISPNRLFNCAYMPIDHPAAFSETMFLLLGGTGVGYSVQKHHVEKLPEILGPKKKTRRYLIGDSIEGWADAIKVLVESYYYNKSDPIYDFRDIRPKGALLVTSGGKAPGPQPLKDCLHNIRKVFDAALSERGTGAQLTSLQVHDIVCYIADAVLAGGIRRAALIALFSFDDEDMLTCKFGNWWELNPQRARANNSAVALRHRIKKKDFFEFWEKVKASGCGEPGIYFTNDKEWGANPCVEIGLRPNQFCNLTTVNVSDVESQEDLNNRVRAAAFIATLQASYTDFHYLRDVWQRTTEKEALIGVSMTGIASGEVLKYNLEEAAEEVKKENIRVAKLININPAARTTCVKPEGTASLVVGSSSGIHAWHSPFYIRRMRLGKNEAIYKYLKKTIPELLEDEMLKPDLESVLSIPIKAPTEAIYRDESALELLERGRLFSTRWVTPGHVSGANKHNVSITVSVRDHEWDEVGVWMWENRNSYNGISVLPYDGGNYIQAPFEECTEEVYNKLLSKCKAIDLSKVTEDEDTTSLKEEAACAGGACTINKI